MARVVEDFQDRDGKWVRSFYKDSLQHYTVAGQKWRAMLDRCKQGGAQQQRYPRYEGCFCGFENFQTFVDWSHTQRGYGQHSRLDKDLLFKGNRVYSEIYCVYIPEEINGFLLKSNGCRGDSPIGTSFNRRMGKYAAYVSCGDQFKHLGYHWTAEAAFDTYKAEKEMMAKELANKWKDQIDPRAYEALMNYTVEITD